MSTTTNGAHNEVKVTVKDRRDVSQDQFEFNLAVLLVFAVVVAWLVTRGG